MLVAGGMAGPRRRPSTCSVATASSRISPAYGPSADLRVVSACVHLPALATAPFYASDAERRGL